MLETMCLSGYSLPWAYPAKGGLTITPCNMPRTLHNSTSHHDVVPLVPTWRLMIQFQNLTLESARLHHPSHPLLKSPSSLNRWRWLVCRCSWGQWSGEQTCLRIRWVGLGRGWHWNAKYWQQSRVLSWCHWENRVGMALWKYLWPLGLCNPLSTSHWI